MPDTEHWLETCFDAVLDQSLWPSRLQHLGETLGARSCVLRATSERHDPSAPRHFDSSAHSDFSALWLSRVEEAPDPHNPGALCRCQPLYRGESVLFDQDIFRDEDRAKMPYFRAIAGPGRRNWWAGTSFTVDREMWVFSLYRAAEDDPFPISQRALLTDVGRHLSRFVRLAQDVRRAWDVQLLETLGFLSLPVALLAADGSVSGLSEPAKALIGRDLWMVNGHLATPNPITTQRLGTLAQAAVRSVRACVSVVVLQKDEPWLVAEGWTLPASMQSRFAGARGAIMFRQVATQPGERTILVETFGLTPAETRVATSLAAGLSTTEICRIFNVSRETVRSQLKALFRKTGAQSQVQLAALLARLSN